VGGKLEWLKAVFAGLVWFCAFAPLQCELAAWLTPAMLLWATAAEPRRAFCLGWIAGAAHFFSSLSWVLYIPVAGSNIVGWVMLTPWMLVELWGSKLPEPSWEEWATICYLGVFSTVLGYAWFARGIDRIGPTSAASYVFLVPVFGVLSGWVFLGEKIGLSMILGFFLIVMGVKEVQAESEKLAG